jgi:hypothetical protein
VWCEVFEGGVHDGTQVDTAEVAGEGAEGVLRVRIVDVEAGLVSVGAQNPQSMGASKPAT